MIEDALGLIETVGLAAAVTAADAAVKSASVQLAGYELTRGGGLVTVKLFGSVGAVKAAVDAGKAAAGKVNHVWATHGIPRPHEEVTKVVLTRDTVGLVPVPLAVSSVPLAEVPVAETSFAENPSPDPNQKTGDVQQLDHFDFFCNLCREPVCPRKKGEPRVKCVHYKENNNKEE